MSAITFYMDTYIGENSIVPLENNGEKKRKVKFEISDDRK